MIRILLLKEMNGGIGISHDRGANWIFDENIARRVSFTILMLTTKIPYNVMGVNAG
jgi:hypothetical protein